VIAPNAFKGTLTAAAAARAIGEGVAAAWPSAVCRALPLADGGDGFLATLLAATGGDQFRCRVPGPLLEPVWTKVGWPGGSGARSAVVELAGACGLRLVNHPSPDSAGRASTRGLGELIRAAVTRGAEQVLVGLGGSASTDGGAGLAQALGFRCLDHKGAPIGPGGLGLIGLNRIELEEGPPPLHQVHLVAACDVDNPLLGARGAAAVFAPQKGADRATVRRLEHGLARLAQIVDRDLHPSVSANQPGMGAAGGAAFGLAAFCGARLESGVSLVASGVGLDSALDQANLVITGEGRFDDASLHGKVTGEVLRRAAARGLPCLVLAGSSDRSAQELARKLGGQVVQISPEQGAPAGPTPRAAFSRLRAATTRACFDWARGGLG